MKFFIQLALVCLIGVSHAAFAADIAILKSHDIEPYKQTIAGFLSSIGPDVRQYDMGGDLDKGRRMAKGLKEDKPKLVVTIGTKAAVAAAGEIADTPVLALLISRPEKYLGKKKNIAAIALNPSPDDQFALLKKVYPTAKKIGVMYNTEQVSPEVARGMEISANEGYEIVTAHVSSEADVPQALRDLHEKADVLWLVMDESIVTRQGLRHIFTFSAQHKFPVIGFSQITVKAGALFSATTGFEEIGRQGAEVAKKLLKGTPPRKIGFIFPRSSGYLLNLRTATIMAFPIDERVIKNADERYE